MSASVTLLRTARLLLAFLAIPFAPAQAADIVLRIASTNVEGSVPYDKVLVPFARALEEDSGGRIEVALKPIGGYGKPAELFSMVERGDIEIAATVQGYSSGRFPQSSVMELPFLFPDAVSGTQAIMSLYREGLLSEDYASVKVLALYMQPPFPIFTTGKTIQSLRDFRGLRMRAPSITVGLALAKLGAVPLGIPLNAIGDAVASGYVDAISYGWDLMAITKGAGGKPLSDQLSVGIDAQLASPALMVVMNRTTWEKLPDDLKAVVEKHGAEFALTSARLREVQEAVAKKKLQSDPRFTSLNFSDEQRLELQGMMAPAIQEWKASMAKLGIDGDRLYRRAIELIQRYKVAAK
jgi:TRAP-type C4-dicarboxylate transport system substrate-binding protein